jgi:AcrR family transcriptional regulator
MTKKRPREQRLSEIVSAAVSEFLEKGYENASMDGIALRAGLTKGGLYHHFEGKDEILIYANSRLSEPVEGLVRRASASRSAASGLRRYIRDYVEFWVSHPRELAFFFLTMTKAFEAPETTKLYAAYYQQMHACFAGLFERAIAEGALRQHDAAAQAVALLAALDGVLSYLAFDSSSNASRVVRQLQDVFVNSVALATRRS